MRRVNRREDLDELREDRKSTRLNSSHSQISYAVFCLKKKKVDTHTSAAFPKNDTPRRQPAAMMNDTVTLMCREPCRNYQSAASRSGQWTPSPQQRPP